MNFSDKDIAITEIQGNKNKDENEETEKPNYAPVLKNVLFYFLRLKILFI